MLLSVAWLYMLGEQAAILRFNYGRSVCCHVKVKEHELSSTKGYI